MEHQNKPFWYYNFTQSISYHTHQLKGHPKNRDRYPAEIVSRLAFVDEADFYQSQPDRIPLFVEQAGGIYPHIPDEIRSQMEGQLVALLKIAAKESEQHQLVLYKQNKGLYQLAVFRNIPQRSREEKIASFNQLSDNEKLTLFMQRTNEGIQTEYDELIEIWWMNRY